VCEVIVCERWYFKFECELLCMCQMVYDKVACLVCVREIIVCERWYVSKLCAKFVCVKMVCDKVVC
jgi:hypothetical protein